MLVSPSAMMEHFLVEVTQDRALARNSNFLVDDGCFVVTLTLVLAAIKVQLLELEVNQNQFEFHKAFPENLNQ